MNEKLKALLLAVAEATKIDVEQLRMKRARNHKIAYAKHVFCFVGCNTLKIKQQVIGDYIGLSQGRVCQVTDRSNFVQKNEQGCREMKSEITEVEQKFEQIIKEMNLDCKGLTE